MPKPTSGSGGPPNRSTPTPSTSSASCTYLVNTFRRTAPKPSSGSALAAEQGDAQAQFQLGVMYDMGLGVPQNNIEAHKWANLAAAQSQGDVYNIYAEFRDAIAEEITPEELAQAQRLARKWQPDRSESHTGTDSYLTETPERNTPLKISPAGTGFVVSSASLLLTNHHVIEGCRAVTVRMEGKDSQLAVLASDEANDLALLKLAKKVSAAASFRLGTGPRPGDSVTVVGFPLKGMVASSAGITTGVVTALAGPAYDVRLMQVTAPVQPGNSGRAHCWTRAATSSEWSCRS